MADEHDTDVAVIGSGFGGSVAALRFAEAGERVTVFERGDWVTRDNHEVDLDALWNPKRHRFGMNQLDACGDNIVPWLGAAVGGGSHVYAGTLKRAVSFASFPPAIAGDDMARYYDAAEAVMLPQRYPDYPPYSEVRATQLLYGVGKKLEAERPELLEEYGPINLAISFAPEDGEGGRPGEEFVNPHGAKQRYSDPREQALLGGDIDSKNTLDKNYLHLAVERGAEIRALHEVDRVEPLEGGGWRLHYTRYVRETSALRRVGRKWLPFLVKPRDESGTFTARRLVLAAGCVGSTEILLRNRDVHGTLDGDRLGPQLGERYTSNGDFLSLVFPFRGVFLGWVGVLAVVIALIVSSWWIAAFGAVAYTAGLLISQRPFDPDIGTTNSDFMRFYGRDGSSQGAYVESGRYPTPVRFTIAVILSSLGLWRPRRYRRIIAFTRFLRRFVPPFALIARTWPIPLLKMGRDDALGTFHLDEKTGRAVIDFDLEANRGFYRYLDNLGKIVAHAAGALWLPNVLFRLTKKLEIPHNQGGVPMGEDPASGVVDHAGRVFGYDDLMVLDGSIMPSSPGPNPALTILALSERAMEHIRAQIDADGTVRAESTAGDTARSA